MDSLVDAIGWRGLAVLAAAFGGQRLYIPTGTLRWDVAHTCGMRLAVALNRAFGGERIEVPLAETVRARRLARIRKRQARRALDAGAAVQDVVTATGLSRRTVGRILRDGGAAPPTGITR